MPKTYTKFSVPINHILRNLKDKPWFKPPPPIKGDTFKMNLTKYCAFHRNPGHTTNNCSTWKRYIEQLVKQMPMLNPQPRQSESTKSLSNPSI
ncbi:hypothetical protein PS1_012543 [Malus domestica]